MAAAELRQPGQASIDFTRAPSTSLASQPTSRPYDPPNFCPRPRALQEPSPLFAASPPRPPPPLPSPDPAWYARRPGGGELRYLCTASRPVTVAAGRPGAPGARAPAGPARRHSVLRACHTATPLQKPSQQPNKLHNTPTALGCNASALRGLRRALGFV